MGGWFAPAARFTSGLWRRCNRHGTQSENSTGERQGNRIARSNLNEGRMSGNCID